MNTVWWIVVGLIGLALLRGIWFLIRDIGNNGR